MLKSGILYLLLVSTIIAEGQLVSIKRPINGNIYAGGLNEVDFFFKKHACNSVFLSTQNGHLERRTNCWYGFVPTDTGRTVIDVKIKSKKKLIKVDEFVVTVKEPNVIIFIGPAREGIVDKKILVANEYLRAESFDFGCTYYYPFSVDSFFIQIIRDTSTIFNTWNVSSRLSADVKAAFQILQSNDKVVISSVVGKTASRKRRIEKQAIFNIRE